MRTVAAPDSTWETRLRWGSRRLTAELLDGRGRTVLTLGDGPEDDVAIGSTARVELTWVPDGLELAFTAGVEGELSRHGDRAKTFSELAAAQRLTESGQRFHLRLEPGDALTLRIGTLIVEIRQARGRFPRLPLDARALVFVALALMAVGIMLASLMAPHELPRLHWLKKGH
ncbi:MAG: hypothetical protein JNJ54_23070 [Myxococcaceae bacterium]|nr:hypothetical protein [Myxococcaceae bacterium]